MSMIPSPELVAKNRPQPGFEPMWDWMADLFPRHRSLTGPGVRDTLKYLGGLIPELTVHEIPSGTRVFDWTVPDEWTLRDAFIENQSGERLVDLKDHPMHVMGYSTPVDAVMTREELEPHLYSLPETPDAIPYIASYYVRRWGFCLSQRHLDRLGNGPFRVRIDSTLEPGSLTYGEVLLPGASEREIFLSTYVCHPGMANNELSGPTLTTALTRWLRQRDRKLSYRIIFIPETIGAIAYLARHAEIMRQRTKAGFILTCCGDERGWSHMPSRLGNTVADRIASVVLARHAPNGYEHASFLERGSDERQYCSPHIDLPVVSIMRSRYTAYPEYHTSKDDLSFVTQRGLEQSFAAMRDAIVLAEENEIYEAVVPCEPMLSPRGLHSSITTREPDASGMAYTNVLAYADGNHDVLAIAQRVGLDPFKVIGMIDRLKKAELLRVVGK